MKFNFQIQDYQTQAVKSVIDCFNGQPYITGITYRRDLGNYKPIEYIGQTQLGLEDEQGRLFDDELIDDTGFRNERLHLSSNDLLTNIRRVQQENNVMLSNTLIGDIGACSLDVEMETGTGKTYVYIKTMYELNQKYGWSKYIVVVPSIAIREGVKKSFEITEDHFMKLYGKKVRFFVYDSKNLTQLDDFSSDAGINVMIINMQAFNTSLKEGAKNKESRIIYSERDEFQSRRPIDVIKVNNPILILDEPQKMGGMATQKALKNFNPLFVLNYSATHKDQHNLVYALDAVDAYNQKLVKKIEVKGFQVKNFRGTDKYMYLEDIILSPNEPPKAKIEFEIAYQKTINREMRILSVDDNLFELSKRMEQYKGYRISDIQPETGKVIFANGEEIQKGEVVGDVSEKDMRRIQIRETIKSHFEKEEILYQQGIKSLTLFFIDEVAKYRQYNESSEEILGEYGEMFEQEYTDVLNEYITLFDTPYQKYLQSIDVSETHKGYFSIDKQGRSVNSETKRGADISDDISAYDLILKHKERLLSFEEPTRFIFSHSALREGWDNPNVFQICTLKHGESTTMKRQEVGRGLRLCVNQDGFRMDAQRIGTSEVHKVNKLTVIASESYKDFVTDLQKELKDTLYDRPRKASKEYFVGKSVLFEGDSHQLTVQEANIIYQYLVKNDYITDDGNDTISARYHSAVESQSLAALPESLLKYEDDIHQLIQSVFNDSILEKMIEDGHDVKIKDNDLNDNFYKKEFQDLWNQINHEYAYTVSFDSDELIRKAIRVINEDLFVSKLQYTTTISEQKDDMVAEEVRAWDSFKASKSTTTSLEHHQVSQIKYDLIGKISENTVLTRKTVIKILKGIREDKFYMFKLNPEEFINKVSRLIKEQKATMIVEHISYNVLDKKREMSIFTADKHGSFDKAFKAEKHIQPYVFTDGTAKDSVERSFAKDLDGAEDVCVYAKLPSGFKIPTPVGNYNPDWAIAFKKGTVKHVFFIAETKGTMETMQLRPVEKAKIQCARKLFNEISTEEVVYHDVDSYQSLLNIMPVIEKNI